MQYDFECRECGTINHLDVIISDQPANWSPPKAISCSVCKGSCKRVFGCAIGVAGESDGTKNIGKSTSSAAGLQFVGKGFPDANRKVDQEVEEIERLMDEPPSKAEMAAGMQQMEEMERGLQKQKGAISGEREMEDIEIVGVSEDESERIKSEERQRLNTTLEQHGVKKIAIQADDVSAAQAHNIAPLAEGEKVVKHVAKRRGKEALSKEMQENKAKR